MNENIISKKELDFILDFIFANENSFKKNAVSSNIESCRKVFTLDKKSNHPTIFFDIKKRILNKEKITKNYINKSPYEDYISFISNGGKVHYHKDPTIPGYDHVRFNLFLSLPKKGGLPIYNGVTIPVKIGDYVRCNSSKEYHGCEKVEGNIPRIIISYGIYLKNENFDLKYF